MPDQSQLSDVDNRAIRMEVGERLRAMLPVDHSELPPCIKNPLSKLRELDEERSPSIVPSLEERGSNSPCGALLVAPIGSRPADAFSTTTVPTRSCNTGALSVSDIVASEFHSPLIV